MHRDWDCKALSWFLYGEVKCCHKIPQQSSAAWQNFPQATLALKLNLLTPIFSSTQLSAKSSRPLAIAPTTTQTLSSGPRVLMYSRALITCASQLNVTFRQFGGRYCVTGCLMTFSSFSVEFVDRIDNLWSNWTMRPANRLNVRGMRTVGLTSISTPFVDWM